jgi:amino acid adenylation domain-containing protein
MNKQLVHSVFESIALKFPDNIAVEYGATAIRYNQLNAFANEVANALIESGLTKGQIAGAFFESNPEYIISILGINKAGLAFMPLEPDFPVKRQVGLLNEVEPQVIIVHQNDMDRLLSLYKEEGLLTRDIKIVSVKLEAEELNIRICDTAGLPLLQKKFSSDDCGIEIDGNDSNYIIYTSGSTGKPKIIEGCHKGLSHFIHWEMNEFNIGSEVKVSQLAPLSFDVSLRDIFVPLLAGGTLCIPEKGLRFQPQQLLQWLISSQVTLVHSVPTLFRLLTEEVKGLADISKELASIKYILLAGEPLFGKDILNWRAVAGNDVTLVNIYGPSETTLAKMFHRVIETNIDPASIIPLGKAISNTAVLILDGDKLCQPGEIGNIFIKTPFRSKGYFKNPGMTKEKFIQNPLQNEFEDIVYDTGDTGKYLEDMSVVFIGRNDHQVKVRGNRVELLEVEKAVASYPGIKGVAVVVINDEKEEDAVLACYYTGTKIDEVSARNYLSSYLLQYMHPSCYIHLDEFPLNSSGKIDRKSLPVPDIMEKDDYEAPTGDLEVSMEKIWMEVLKVERVSRSESFFNIGGSSLKGIKIISKIYKECNILIKLPDLFGNPTIKQLAMLLKKSELKSYNEIKPVEKKAYYDLSHAQKRLWILSHFEEQHIGYNMLYAFKFNGKLDVNSLTHALEIMVDRHEIMRTVFVNVDGEPKQKILSVKEFGFTLVREDLRMEPDAESLIRKIARVDWATPFDLENGPLFRAKLLHLPADEFVFIFSTHHIISDGWSSNIIMKEVPELYEACLNGQPDPLEPLKIQYKDFAAWQNALLEGNKLNHYKDYWLNQFTPLPALLELPSDQIRPKVKTFSAKHYAMNVNKEVLAVLSDICNKNEATLFMALLSTVNILFYRLTGQTDITIGTPITGREHEDLENQIGVFVNTLALRTRFKESNNFSQLLQNVKGVTSGAYEHQLYPFDYLVDELNLERDLSRSPLFEVMVVLHDSGNAAEVKKSSMDDVAMGSYYVAPVASKFDLNLNFTEKDEQLYLEVDYNNDVFSENFIQTVFDLYKNLLESVVVSPQQPISALSLLDNRSREKIVALNSTIKPYCGSLTIQEMFEQQVTADPDAAALTDDGGVFTYQQLNEKANAIAHCLVSNHSVQPGDPVAVMLSRSVYYLAAVLGVLKAGAVFVPLDIDYPAERISTILGDLQPKVLISSPGGYDSELLNVPVLELAPGWSAVLESETTNPPILVSGNSLAYILYTSGSTGKPKGVAVENSSLVNYVNWANSYYFDNRKGNTFAFNTSISFDLTLTSIFTTLLRGDKLVVYGNELETADVLKSIFDVNSAVNTVKITPSHINLLGNLELARTNVTVVIVGGEKLYEHQVELLQSLNPRIRIFNEYGPTEATIGCTVNEIFNLGDVSSIGTPIDNTGIFITDASGNVQPAGVPGEIFITGAGLAKGYFKNEAQTALKFKGCTFLGTTVRAYASGDIGKLTADGKIELLGRIDKQVKIRGYRIELEEIEKAMLAMEGIKEVFAKVICDEEGEKHIAAYFTGGAELNTTELRRCLKQKLPLYMIPLYFIQVNEFTLTTNGKLNEKVLPDPFNTEADVQRVFTAPDNKIESDLLTIWESVLKKGQIGTEDDFFELGGHSLNATRILSRISKEMDVRISLKSLFTYTTIKTLAEHISKTDITDVNLVSSEAAGEEEDTFII